MAIPLSFLLVSLLTEAGLRLDALLKGGLLGRLILMALNDVDNTSDDLFRDV